MLKRWSFWGPLGLALALIFVLGFVVSDPFGENLSSYVGAASTLVLVAVTASYVITTYSLADTAREQLDLTRQSRSLDAVQRLWKTHQEVRGEPSLIALELRHIRGAVSQGEDLSRGQTAALTTTRVAEARKAMSAFTNAIAVDAPHLPTAVHGAAVRLDGVYTLRCIVGDAVARIVHEEAVLATAAAVPLSVAKIKQKYDKLRSGVLSALPEWDTLGGEVEVRELQELEAAFTKAIIDFSRTLHPDGPRA